MIENDAVWIIKSKITKILETFQKKKPNEFNSGIKKRSTIIFIENDLSTIPYKRRTIQKVNIIF